MLRPALSRAKQASHPAACFSHLGPMGIFVPVYAVARDDRMPKLWKRPIWVNPAPGAAGRGRGYTSSGSLLSQTRISMTASRCPSDHRYSTEDYCAGRAVRLRRFAWRLDGSVSKQAPLSRGEITIRPLRFAGKPGRSAVEVGLVPDFSASATGRVECELLDATGAPLPGFELVDSGVLFGDAIQHTVTGTGDGNLNSPMGKPVRILFVLNDAHLYSSRFRQTD